jgi:hypothetical protein
MACNRVSPPENQLIAILLQHFLTCIPTYLLQKLSILQKITLTIFSMIKQTLITLFARDISKLRSEIAGYPDAESLWAKLPGTSNSGGNLCQHLIGNLRTYVGLTLGAVTYVRDRDAEFSKRIFSQTDLLQELDHLEVIVQNSLEQLDEEKLYTEYPREVLDMFPEQTILLVLQHLLTHLSYHLGQINYHRRWVANLL